VLWPQLIIIGGGISNVADKFLPLIQLRTPIVPAQLRNHAGIIGAAMFAPQE
jgi:polyphosphate glucokinase